MMLWQLCHEKWGIPHPDLLPPMTSRQITEIWAYYIAQDLPQGMKQPRQTPEEMRTVLRRAGIGKRKRKNG